MAEAPSNGSTQPQQQPKMKVLSQYVRDLSFENIAAQKEKANEAQPQIKVQVNLDANKKTDTRFEVILKVSVNAESNGDAVFVLEVDYAGIFEVENVPAEQLHPYLMIECPRMLFPYMRRIVGDMTRDGGYPPLNLDNIDFMQLYRCLLYTSPSPRDQRGSRMPSSA